jgi:hypothetical protein
MHARGGQSKIERRAGHGKGFNLASCSAALVMLLTLSKATALSLANDLCSRIPDWSVGA